MLISDSRRVIVARVESEEFTSNSERNEDTVDPSGREVKNAVLLGDTVRASFGKEYGPIFECHEERLIKASTEVRVLQQDQTHRAAPVCVGLDGASGTLISATTSEQTGDESKDGLISHRTRLSNESRLSCGAELEGSQGEFYHTARKTFSASIGDGRRQLQALLGCAPQVIAQVRPRQERRGALGITCLTSGL